VWWAKDYPRKHVPARSLLSVLHRRRTGGYSTIALGTSGRTQVWQNLWPVRQPLTIAYRQRGCASRMQSRSLLFQCQTSSKFCRGRTLLNTHTLPSSHINQLTWVHSKPCFAAPSRSQIFRCIDLCWAHVELSKQKLMDCASLRVSLDLRASKQLQKVALCELLGSLRYCLRSRGPHYNSFWTTQKWYWNGLKRLRSPWYWSILRSQPRWKSFPCSSPYHRFSCNLVFARSVGEGWARMQSQCTCVSICGSDTNLRRQADCHFPSAKSCQEVQGHPAATLQYLRNPLPSRWSSASIEYYYFYAKFSSAIARSKSWSKLLTAC